MSRARSYLNQFASGGPPLRWAATLGLVVAVALAGCGQGKGSTATGPSPLSSVTAAQVTVDADTGKGFVGKGDVQGAFKWTNAELQNNAGGVTFEVRQLVQTTITCEKTTLKKTVTTERTRVRRLFSAVAYGDRKNPKEMITGFILTGYTGDPRYEGALPTCDDGGFVQVGDPEDEFLPSAVLVYATHGGVTRPVGASN